MCILKRILVLVLGIGTSLGGYSCVYDRDLTLEVALVFMIETSLLRLLLCLYRDLTLEVALVFI